MTILAEFIFNLRIEGDQVFSKEECLNNCYISSIKNKQEQVRDHYGDKVSTIITIELRIQNRFYILGFDPTVFYFYLYSANTGKVELFFTKDEIQDQTFACLCDGIFRKEIEL